MAIFGTKKEAAKKVKKGKAPEKAVRAAEVVRDEEGKLSMKLTAPWLSEKALIATEKGVYTFHIPADTTKKEVALAVEKIYKVVPRKVTVVNLPAKRYALRTRRGFGVRAARRKAYVFLNKGDVIEFA
jgi:large subunit ribosomal protein L23